MSEKAVNKATIRVGALTSFRGPKGDKGEPGYTPVRGVDYWTEEDRAPVEEAAQGANAAAERANEGAQGAEAATESAGAATQRANEAAAKAESVEGRIAESIAGFESYNAYDLIGKYGSPQNRTINGVTFAWEKKNGFKCKVQGTATALAFSNIIDGSADLKLNPGDVYTFIVKSTSNNLYGRVYLMKGDAIVGRSNEISNESQEITITEGVTHLFIRVNAYSGAYDDEISLQFLNAKSNMDLQREIEEMKPKKYALPSSDLNDYSDTIFALITDSNTYQNTPNNYKAGFFWCFRMSTGICQFFKLYSKNELYVRTRLISTGFGEWMRIGEGTVINNHYEFPSYSNTYNVTATPTIRTDTNAYLAPDGNADRTADMIAMLTSNGICRLGKGTYYIKDLVMPNDTTIEGVGNGTTLVLTNDASFGIKMGNCCICRNFNIVGKTAAITPQSEVRNKHGILWSGNYTQSNNSELQPKTGILENLFIAHFEGGGITCYDTGYGTFNHLEVTNCYIWNCDAGINVSYWSEFHQFTNVRSYLNYYGCVNNGGNNVFTNCDFSKNTVGFLMDNAQGQSPNNSHGSAIGCVFNHIDNNTGIAMKVLNCDNGFIFDGCQVFFGQIMIDESNGIVVSNTNFGHSNCRIKVNGGGVVLFANNVHQAMPDISITNNSHVHFSNCYVRSTGAVVSN